ncbi:MAG: long-chain fatty acid--CoA ligase [Bacillaceae bacterium]|nr:long-chain fatty acid--CoA ligase [Bacillaceae bacterium]
MNFADTITRIASENPEKSAVETPDIRLSYLELEQKINQTANAFKTIGLEKGERVLIQISNRPEFMYCYFAAMKMGAIIVPINPLYTPSEISYIAENSEPAIYVCEHSSQGNIRTVEEKSAKLIKSLVLDHEDEDMNFQNWIDRQAPDYTRADFDEHDVCEILYTSGTTGKPKGAMLTHHSLYTNADTYKETMQVVESDKSLIVAPLYHAAAQTNCMNTLVLAGATNFLLPKFDPKTILQTIEEEEITYFFGPPTMYTIILNNPDLEKYDLNLRIAFTGSSPLPVEVFHKWKDIFGFEILEGYGLSECSPVVTMHTPDGIKKPGSIGPTIDGVEVKIVNENGEELPNGEVGELIVRGPNVMKGYWRRPDATEKAIRNGWFHTGDLGYRDDDNFFYIADRQKDMINRGGMKIYPREVEEVLYQHPQVLEASVIGVPDPVMGEEIKACITLRNPEDSIDFDALSEFCRKHLAPYKIPRLYEVLDEMPKTLSGKIKKTDLRQWHEQKAVQ